LVGFKFLGIRLSKNALAMSLKKYDAQMNESTVLFKQAFIIALTEEIQTFRVAYKNGLSLNMARKRK